MDYSACRKMFTIEQRKKIRTRVQNYRQDVVRGIVKKITILTLISILLFSFNPMAQQKELVDYLKLFFFNLKSDIQALNFAQHCRNNSSLTEEHLPHTESLTNIFRGAKTASSLKSLRFRFSSIPVDGLAINSGYFDFSFDNTDPLQRIMNLKWSVFFRSKAEAAQFLDSLFLLFSPLSLKSERIVDEITNGEYISFKLKKPSDVGTNESTFLLFKPIHSDLFQIDWLPIAAFKEP
jgi:hypothetical protein